jgi:hypothetical protein
MPIAAGVIIVLKNAAVYAIAVNVVAFEKNVRETVSSLDATKNPLAPSVIVLFRTIIFSPFSM